MAPQSSRKASDTDPGKIPEFDRVMRGLMHVPKAEVDASIEKERREKKPKRKK